MKETGFIISQGGRDRDTHLPQVFIARAKIINPKAQQHAELRYLRRIKKAADIHYNTLKPVRNMYEEEDNRSLTDFHPTLLLRYFNEMEKLEKALDVAYLHKAEQARNGYRTAILTILGHHYLGIPTFPFDLHSMRSRCSVVPNTLKEDSETTHKREDQGAKKRLEKEEFFKIIMEQPIWAIMDLICALGMTEDELTSTILEYKNELEVHVEAEYTLSGILRTKIISFKIRERERNPLADLYGD